MSQEGDSKRTSGFDPQVPCPETFALQEVSKETDQKTVGGTKMNAGVLLRMTAIPHLQSRLPLLQTW